MRTGDIFAGFCGFSGAESAQPEILFVVTVWRIGISP
jgi:hypothetical protein